MSRSVQTAGCVIGRRLSLLLLPPVCRSQGKCASEAFVSRRLRGWSDPSVGRDSPEAAVVSCRAAICMRVSCKAGVCMRLLDSQVDGQSLVASRSAIGRGSRLDVSVCRRQCQQATVVASTTSTIVERGALKLSRARCRQCKQWAAATSTAGNATNGARYSCDAERTRPVQHPLTHPFALTTSKTVMSARVL